MALRVPIEILFERAGETIVISEQLKAGDLIIIDGNERLMPGSPIAPRMLENQSPAAE